MKTQVWLLEYVREMHSESRPETVQHVNISAAKRGRDFKFYNNLVPICHCGNSCEDWWAKKKKKKSFKNLEQTKCACLKIISRQLSFLNGNTKAFSHPCPFQFWVILKCHSLSFAMCRWCGAMGGGVPWDTVTFKSWVSLKSGFYLICCNMVWNLCHSVKIFKNVNTVQLMIVFLATD